MFSVFALFRNVATNSWIFNWFLLHFMYATFWFLLSFYIHVSEYSDYLYLPRWLHSVCILYLLHHLMYFPVCLPLSPSSNSIWILLIFFPLHTNCFLYYHMLIMKIMGLIVTFSCKNVSYIYTLIIFKYYSNQNEFVFRIILYLIFLLKIRSPLLSQWSKYPTL